MKTVTIRVTEEDINNGVAFEPGKCAVALAASRCLGGKCSVFEEDDGFQIELGCLDSIVLPDKVQEFIRRFDEHGLVEPISFQVELD